LTGLSAVALAEYFRDIEGKNVLFFIDNVFRFVQAGNELSMLTNAIPSEDSYQATLASELGAFHERLSGTCEAAISSVEAVYVPNDDLLDSGVQAIFPHLDSMIVLSRSLYQEGLLPAVDVLASSFLGSLDPQIVGEVHYNNALLAQNLLKKAVSLERIVSLVGEAELSIEDQTTYQRAKKLRNYMTQSFFVVEKQTGRPGRYVPLETTVADVGDIISGKYDKIPEERFLFIGSTKELR
jgi:F-type H+-transporting ATPase subunit beta